MGLRSQESISEEILYKKGNDRDWYKSALMLVQTFNEEYIRSEMAAINGQVILFEAKKTGNKLNDQKIEAEIKRLKSKFKMFNYLLI